MRILFLYPWVFLFIIPLVFFFIFVIGKTFVRFRDAEQRKSFNRSRRLDKLVLIITRSAIAACLIVALASPYEFTKIETPGDPSLTILVDKSTSFSLFEQGLEDKLKQKIGGQLPDSIKTLDQGNRSALGNGVRNTIQGNDNVLLITDGFTTEGWNLGDAIVFARDRNSVINALDLSPEKGDASVVISGPSEVIQQTDNAWSATVQVAGKVEYQLRVIVDGGELIKTTGSSSKKYTFDRIFSRGYHKIQAILRVDDTFEENNMYYKTVKALPRPNVLFVSKEGSPMYNVLDEIYEMSSAYTLPGSLESYHAVVLNNFPEQELQNSVDQLSAYLEEGNGLFVIGGDKSFEYNDHCAKGQNKRDCQFQALLPVQIGYGGTEKLGNANIVLVIDISGSAGEEFGGGSSTQKLAIQKALAIEILKDLKLDDNVAVVAFNTQYRLISDLTPLYDKPDLNQTIAKLQFIGGTLISQGLRKANDVLQKAQGSKSVILISDGNAADPEIAVQLATAMRQQGITIYSVGIGENTNVALMSALADAGGGVFLQPTDTQKLKIAMGESEGEEKEVSDYALQILNANSFITQNIELSGKITGFNQVVPKSSGRVLVTTEFNNPVLSSWRYGLGRVVVLSTDDGSKWGAGLLQKKNSRILTRSLNYAIGDPDRLKDFAVKIDPGRVDEPVEINVFSTAVPELKQYTFAKTEQGARDLYTTTYTPEKPGFYYFFDAITAANYPLEYEQVGMSTQLEELITTTGGKMFKKDDAKGIVENAKQESKRLITDYKFYRWPFILAAVVLLLGEIAFRKFREAKHYREG